MGNLLKCARIGIDRIHFYIVRGSAHEQEAAFEIESQLVHRCPAKERRARHGRKDSCDVIASKDGDTGPGPPGASTSAEHERLLELGVRRSAEGEDGADEEKKAQGGRERPKRYKRRSARVGNGDRLRGHEYSAAVIDAAHSGFREGNSCSFTVAPGCGGVNANLMYRYLAIRLLMSSNSIPSWASNEDGR
jgi:hypothetical protein